MKDEKTLAHSLSDPAQRLLASYESLLGKQKTSPADLPAEVASSLAGIRQAAELSQVPLVLGDNEQGEAVVQSTGSQGSGILSSLGRANCYIVLDADQGPVPAGEIVSVQLFDSLIS